MGGLYSTSTNRSHASLTIDKVKYRKIDRKIDVLMGGLYSTNRSHANLTIDKVKYR